MVLHRKCLIAFGNEHLKTFLSLYVSSQGKPVSFGSGENYIAFNRPPSLPQLVKVRSISSRPVWAAPGSAKTGSYCPHQLLFLLLLLPLSCKQSSLYQLLLFFPWKRLFSLGPILTTHCISSNFPPSGSHPHKKSCEAVDIFRHYNEVPNLGLGPKWDQSPNLVPKKSQFRMQVPNF